MGLEQWYWYYTAFFGSLGPDRDNAPEPTCGTLMWYSTTCSHSLYTHSQPATNTLRARGEKMVENRKTGENCATASQPGLCLNPVAPPAPGEHGLGARRGGRCPNTAQPCETSPSAGGGQG